MIGQAAGFALLAAISPTALFVMAVFLASANPRLTALAYVAGAFVMTIVMAIVVLYVLRSTGLNLPHNHNPRYEFRLVLGVLALAGAVLLARRKRPVEPDPAKPSQGLMSRLISRPNARTAFGAGVLLFAPSATFIAAVQVPATARAAVPLTALTLVIIILLTCMVVWLPLLCYLAAPDKTTRWLKTVNDWLRAHGKKIGVYALEVGGLVLIINGALGVAGVI
jgi:threonine/homoserine/homoserine lactone efflux protein